MDKMATATLLELAAKSLLSNELAAIRALEEIPRDLFVPLFISAFMGGHAKVLKEMVRVWPFPCLHIGKLRKEDSDEMLEAMIDGLQLIPAQNPSSCRSKLMVLDLMQEDAREITCSVIMRPFPFCPYSCAFSECSIRKREVQRNVRCLESGNSESESQPCWKPMELAVEICGSDDPRKKQFLSFLQKKFEESSGSLHLCCRSLNVESFSSLRNILGVMDLDCTMRLDVHNAYLNQVTKYFAQMTNLSSISMSDISVQSCNGRNFRKFLIWLGKQYSLQDLNLFSFYLRNRLQRVLRLLPHELDTLCLPNCFLSARDVMALSQSCQVPGILHLDLSENEIVSEVYETFRILLENASGTLQHLEIDNCVITDFILSALLPALSQCSRLRILSFAANPISMHMLRRSLQCFTSLTDLKHVTYPVPVECYAGEDVYGSLDMHKVDEVQAQLKVMLQAVQRDDMSWNTSLE